MVDTLLLHLSCTLQSPVPDETMKPLRKRSRHTIECDRFTSTLPNCHRAVQFWHDVIPMMEQYNILQNVPVKWRLHDDAGEQTRFMHTLIREVWRVAEKYSPGFLTREFPTLGLFLSAPTINASTVIADAPPVQLMTQTSSPSLLASDTTTEDEMSPNATEKSHNAIVPMISNGAHGSIYQRRAQFRMALAGFQGKPGRAVPPEVIQDIQDQLHETAKHLIDMTADPSDRLQRYRAVTRVHILTLMRSIGNGRYSRWYRESHYIHRTGFVVGGLVHEEPRSHVITAQPPPNIGQIETTLIVMFGMGTLANRRKPPWFFFAPKREKQTQWRRANPYTPTSTATSC